MSDASTNPERIRSALWALNPDLREVWVRAGTCIKSELGEEGFDIWDDWGANGKGYKASDARSVWKSLKAAGGLTINSLFYDAKGVGWKDSTTYQKPSKAEIEARRVANEARAAQAAAEEAVAHDAAALRAQKLWDAAAPADSHPYLDRKGVLSHGLRVGQWEVRDSETGEIIVVTTSGLLIPLRDRQRKLWSLQCIHPDANKKKMYLRDGAKRGHFHGIGAKPLKRDDRPVFVLVEGYATGASVHECTGHFVLVCFDTSNLLNVAATLRERLPDAIIIFAADNDAAVEGNPGVRAATRAALAVSGLVAVPPPGDFNDLHLAEGPDAVVECLDEATAPVAPAEAPTPSAAPEALPAEAPAAPAAPAALASVVPDDEHPDADAFDSTGYFIVLGYDRGTYYIFQHEQRQIMEAQAGRIGSDAFMLELAPINFWEMYLPRDDGKPGLNNRGFMNWFFRVAAKKGIYDPSRIRGRGAWLDNGRYIFHHGLNLSVDGEMMDVTKITNTKYVYELAKSLPSPADKAMTDAEGAALLETASLFRWSKQGAAPLLAGWTFLAAVCGAMKWRPHIWLTGGAGCGKSTILNDYVNALLPGIAVFAQGNSSEAGIRQELLADALPVLFDESEQNNEAEKRRMDGVISLIRQASTESPARTLKGTISGASMRFHIRSMFCLASIQVGMEHKADQDRLTKLTLMKPAEDGTAAANWAKIKAALYIIERDKTLANRMLRRAINMLPVIHQNIAVFITVAAAKFGTQRLGDQYGTLLAGAWSMCFSEPVTPEQAAAMIDRYEWAEFTEGGEVDDSEKALRAILEAKIMHKGDAISVGSIITLANDGIVEGLTLEASIAKRLMRDNGMNFSKGHLVFQNGSKALTKMVADTPFAADLSGQLLRVPNAKKFTGCRFGSTMSRAIGIPLAQVVHPNDDEPPI